MSIQERLEDAKLLWENGRKDGAWTMVLIAAAATSNLRFPVLKSSRGDKAAFTEFIREVTPTIMDASRPATPGGVTLMMGSDRANSISLADLLYKHLRCKLVHEAEIDPNVQLSESRVIDEQLVAELRVGWPFGIPDFWALNLAKAIQEAPDNTALFAGSPVF